MPDSTASSRFQKFGGYEVEGELGRGGMGVVYLARQLKLNRRVALKTLTGHYGKEELQRFLAEAETAAGLHHTNIAQIYEVGEHDGVPFYSMEYVEGGSVADRLRKELPNPRDAAQLLILVARALHVAHQNGVVHRDMKPANILLDPDGIPKVADFGIAKRLKQDSQLTMSGAVIGTPTYMAPEQAKGTSRHVGPEADVYSLGAILYEMLAGRPPFLPEDSETALTVRVLTEDPVSPAWHQPATPRDLEVICMKCLEKNPKDRYESAAAFAEDLRRYLDDETIVARPPTTIVKTIKWIKRHPWKFVAASTGFLLAIAGAVWLTHWELYRRPHREYAVGVEYRYGVPEPMGSVSKSQFRQRPLSLRLTRTGRWGPIVRLETVNARGYPGNLDAVLREDAIPNWLELAFSTKAESRRTRESTRIDFVYDQKVLTEAIARDRNGILTWHSISDRPSSAQPNRMLTRYVTARGFDYASFGGAALVQLERDAAGRDIQVKFLDGSGQPAVNREGVFGYAFRRDNAGRVVHVTNLGQDGKPGPNKDRQIAFALQLNARGLRERMELRDAEDKPLPLDGVLASSFEYDAADNLRRITRLDSDNRPVSTATVDWAVQEIDRNDHGEIVETRFYSASSSGQLTQISKKNFAYDERGFPNDVRFSGATAWHTALKFDDVGNIVEEIVVGPDGKPAAGDEGWAIHRTEWHVSSEGYRQEETWFDANNAPTYAKMGAHCAISEVDSSGNLYRWTTEQHDPSRFKYQRYVNDIQYDAQGRHRRSVVRFQNRDGTPATNAGLAFVVQELTLDEKEQEILEWQLGCAPEVGAPSIRIDTEWHRTGAKKRVIRQACDNNRNPLSVLSDGRAARVEQEYNELGFFARIYETGFDEALVGYFTREAKFEMGNLSSVTHHRADGSALESVNVFVKGVTPEQPKAAELRVGDQLVLSNDNPVTSAYGWVTTPFRGGWIEVIRAGKRIRIDGFEPGTLGITLEDRAPDKPMSGVN